MRLYVHTILNALLTSWLIHMFARSLGERDGSPAVWLISAVVIVVSFPGYVSRNTAEKTNGQQ